MKHQFWTISLGAVAALFLGLQSPAAGADEGGQTAQSVLDMPFADKVDLHHEPPLETDGPIDGAYLAAIAKAETEASARAFAEPPATESTRTVDGNFVTMKTHMKGVLIDGTQIDYTTEVKLEVVDGKVVAMHSLSKPEASAQHRKILEVGKFERPTVSTGD